MVAWCCVSSFLHSPGFAGGRGPGGGDLVLTVGIVSQQSSSALARRWAPILRRLGRDTGIEFRFRTAKDIPTFERRFAEGEYALAYMSPYHYPVFHAQATAKLFATTTQDAVLAG